MFKNIMKNVSLISLQGRGVFKGELRGLEHPFPWLNREKIVQNVKIGF